MVLTSCAPPVLNGKTSTKAPHQSLSSPVPSVTPSDAPPPAPIMNAADYGVIGDGVADDSNALQSLLLYAVTIGAEVLLAPRSRVRLRTTIRVPSKTRLDGNFATVINATPGVGGRSLVLQRVENVAIQNLNFDGAKSKFAAATEQRHNLVLSGASNVTLTRLSSYSAKGDGLYIGDQSNGPSINVTISDSSFFKNHRQGLSITCASSVTVTDCKFTSSVGTAPGAGVDIEPNADNSVIAGVLFRDCVFEGNAGGGLQVNLSLLPSVTQESGTYIGCSFINNPGSSGVVLGRSRGASFSGGVMSGNDIDGMTIWSATDTTLDSVTLAQNGRSGIETAGSYLSLGIDRAVFSTNGATQLTGGFGVNSAPASGHSGIGLRVTNSSFVDMHGGIQINSACSDSVVTGNQYSGIIVDEVLAGAS
jgi:Pectate lyase superfamily protein